MLAKQINARCEKNSRFSSLLAAWDVSREGTSATQRQKFHTDDVRLSKTELSISHLIMFFPE